MEEVDKEISETRLSLNARTRIVAESYLATVGDLSRSTERALTFGSTVYMKELVLCVIAIALMNLQGFQAMGNAKYRVTNKKPNPLSAKYTRGVLSKTSDGDKNEYMSVTFGPHTPWR